MNKFLTYEGQQPIYLGDIDFMNEAVRDTFAHLARVITGQDKPTCILIGCNATLNGTSDGIVCIEGEILPASASELSTGHYEILSIYGGERRFKDSQLRYCWENRFVNLIEGPGAYNLDELPRLNIAREEINEKFFDIDYQISFVKSGDVRTILGTVNIEKGNSSIAQFKEVARVQLSMPDYFGRTYTMAVGGLELQSFGLPLQLQVNAGELVITAAVTSSTISGTYHFSCILPNF